MPRRPDLLCAGGCGRLLWRGTTSLPEGQAKCQPCRRQAHKATAGLTCFICSGPITPSPRSLPQGEAAHARCKQQQAKQKTCKHCHKPFTPKFNTTLHCDECKQDGVWRTNREPKPPSISGSTPLQWTQCLCGKWVAKRGRKWCSDTCAKDATALRYGRNVRNGKCLDCQTALPSRKHKYCDDHRQLHHKACRSKRRKILGSGTHRSRARFYGVEYEPVNRLVVFKRDNWTCGICRERIDPKLKYPHLKSASLDHIIPMANGGGHTYQNTQASHLVCNIKKSNTGYGDQLALIG